MNDARILQFPNTVEIAMDSEPEIDFEVLATQQSDLLFRWRTFGEELKRRAECPIPFDLSLELYDLINATNT